MKQFSTFTLFVLLTVFLSVRFAPGQEETTDEKMTMSIYNTVEIVENPVPDKIPTIRFMLGTTPAVQDVGYLIARDMEYYNEAGLPSVVIEWNTWSVHSSRILYPGLYQFCIADVPQVCYDVSKGERFSVLMTLIHETTSGILYRNDWNKNIQSLSDFNGKNLCYYVTRSVSVELALKMSNISCNLFPVTHKNASLLQPNAMNGICIRAYHLPGPMLFSRHRNSFSFLAFKDMFNVPEDGLICTRAFAERHPDLCERFIEASIRGWQKAAEDENLAIETLERCYNEKQIAFDRKIVIEEYHRFREFLLHRQLSREGLATSREEYDRIMDVMVRAEIIESNDVPEFGKLFFQAEETESGQPDGTGLMTGSEDSVPASEKKADAQESSPMRDTGGEQ